MTAARLVTILELRASGKRWAEVGKGVGLKPETCRRAAWAAKRARRAVGNPPDGVNNPSAEA